MRLARFGANEGLACLGKLFGLKYCMSVAQYIHHARGDAPSCPNVIEAL